VVRLRRKHSRRLQHKTSRRAELEYHLDDLRKKLRAQSGPHTVIRRIVRVAVRGRPLPRVHQKREAGNRLKSIMAAPFFAPIIEGSPTSWTSFTSGCVSRFRKKRGPRYAGERPKAAFPRALPGGSTSSPHDDKVVYQDLALPRGAEVAEQG
jgi:hypothetical protein